MNRILGRCSKCKGNVVTPEAWMAITPPPMTCEKCGAVSADEHLPVIPMVPAPKPCPRRDGSYKLRRFR